MNRFALIPLLSSLRSVGRNDKSGGPPHTEIKSCKQLEQVNVLVPEGPQRQAMTHPHDLYAAEASPRAVRGDCSCGSDRQPRMTAAAASDNAMDSHSAPE
jgi:hypothetical protein